MSVVALKKKPSDDVAAGKEVLRKEAETLTQLAETLDKDFGAAVETLFNATGRVIVSGMGKSGHIGAKIAATFASTGTPAFFVHPGEASHGDLGMIAKDDVILAISHSGNSKELGDILAYGNRFGISIIAITGNTDSPLGQAAGIVLLDGVTTEACPLNLAPTSSTTASLGIGDALAVALMTRRGFQSEDFSQYHPGGKLGSRLMKVEQLMAQGKELPLAKPTETMDTVLLEMTSKNRGGVGIVDEQGKLAGIITDGDLKRHMGKDLLHQTAENIMTKDPLTISPGMHAAAAVNLMQEKNRMMLFVVDEQGHPVGVLQIQQFLQAGVI